MSFCSKCSYIMDISNSSNIESLNYQTKSNNDLVNMILSGEIINIVYAREELSKFEKSDNYKKLNKKQKKQVKEEFKKFLKKKLIRKQATYYYYCLNCKNYKSLENGELLSTEFFYKKQIINEDYKIICSNPTMPRIRNFSCKKCKSFEGIIYKSPGTFNTKLICCKCYQPQ